LGQRFRPQPIRAGPKIRSIWEELRAECPVVHTKASSAAISDHYEAVKEIATIRAFFPRARHPWRDVAPTLRRRHHRSHPTRRNTNLRSSCCLPPFTPDAMKKRNRGFVPICNELIDEFIADGKCDAAARYTKHVRFAPCSHARHPEGR